MVDFTCFECGAALTAATGEELGLELLAHARANHAWPWPDQAIRNYGEALERLTGPSERLDALGAIEVHRMTAERMDDWLQLFDHEGFVGKPEWAACYCLEPHVENMELDAAPWRASRENAVARLRAGTTEGYLAYVDGKVAGWVNASRRRDLRPGLQSRGDETATGDDVCVACFVIAPPYRSHGVAGALLDAVVADAAGRGAEVVEAWPSRSAEHEEAAFRGPRSLFDARGFAEAAVHEQVVVVRRTLRDAT